MAISIYVLFVIFLGMCVISYQIAQADVMKILVANRNVIVHLDAPFQTSPTTIVDTSGYLVRHFFPSIRR